MALHYLMTAHIVIPSVLDDGTYLTPVSSSCSNATHWYTHRDARSTYECATWRTEQHQEPDYPNRYTSIHYISFEHMMIY